MPIFRKGIITGASPILVLSVKAINRPALTEDIDNVIKNALLIPTYLYKVPANRDPTISEHPELN
jgi:hypothetical protein